MTDEKLHGTPEIVANIAQESDNQAVKEKWEELNTLVHLVHKDKVIKLNLQGKPILNKLKNGQDITYDGKKLTAKAMTYKQIGKKITIVLDTEFIEKIISFAKDSDLLICESTYSNKEKEKAKERNHMTNKQAAKIAKKAGAKKLILTHFSQRYKETSELEKEAKSIFKNTEIGKDFMRIKV